MVIVLLMFVHYIIYLYLFTDELDLPKVSYIYKPRFFNYDFNSNRFVSVDHMFVDNEEVKWLIETLKYLKKIEPNKEVLEEIEKQLKTL